MRTAYAVLGLLFILVIIGAGISFEQSEEDIMALTLTSSAFEHNGTIPAKYTCDGENISPPLSISGVPEGTQSLVLIMDDPDAVKPAGHVWDHWVVYNIPPGTTKVQEAMEPAGEQGVTSSGRTGYGGPCPPDGEHQYSLKLYALSGTLSFDGLPTKAEVEAAMEGKVLTQTKLIGLYTRTK